MNALISVPYDSFLYCSTKLHHFVHSEGVVNLITRIEKFSLQLFFYMKEFGNYLFREPSTALDPKTLSLICCVTFVAIIVLLLLKSRKNASADAL